MSDDLVARAVGTFGSRLRSLLGWMDKAEGQMTEQGRDLAELVGARVAPDMYPLPYQIVFTCNQPEEFLAWCRGGAYAQPDPLALDWAGLKDHIAATLAALDEALAVGIAAPSDKHIDLMAGAYLDLSAQRYVDDWLLPNFYFHLVTAYALLRASGVAIGKVDYMTHLAGDVRLHG